MSSFFLSFFKTIFSYENIIVLLVKRVLPHDLLINTCEHDIRILLTHPKLQILNY